MIEITAQDIKVKDNSIMLSVNSSDFLRIQHEIPLKTEVCSEGLHQGFAEVKLCVTCEVKL